jgi:hypothetical protein
MYHECVMASGASWHLYREAYPEKSFRDFWMICCESFSMHSFPLGWFFTPRDDFVVSKLEEDVVRSVKTEPLSPLAADDNFAYVCDIAEQ